MYVGQTRKGLETRDKQHRLSNKTTFDQAYDGNNFSPMILETNSFDKLTEAVSWMNIREAHFVNQYNTYDNGFNTTHDGQYKI